MFKRMLKRLFRHLSPKIRRPQRPKTRLRVEYLEDRLAPATLLDAGGTTLTLNLAANENLSIVSNGTSYVFGTNQTFTATSGTDPANQGTAFTGFGSNALTLTSTG